jgi:phosphoglycerate dehydrogenase-like enzyme
MQEARPHDHRREDAMTKPLNVSIAPFAQPEYVAAIEASGSALVEVGADTDALVWCGRGGAAVGEVLAKTPSVRFVQLPSAGIESYRDAGVLVDDIVWGAAKGTFAQPVAEHALALILAGLRDLPRRARATSWGEESGLSLFDATVLIIGAGGIARQLIELLAPFRTTIVVLRRDAAPLEGADRTIARDGLVEALPEADVVVVAAALTDDTRGLLGAAEFAAMKPTATLVNIARGALVDTDALLDALARDAIRGVGLDVTDPEPLPDGHPLWLDDRVLITPHTADTDDMVRPLLAERIRVNLERFARGEEIDGRVDLAAGY